ncbi:MAG TPA: Crp/Fnr family transcriptional regulator [Saprospiraceae bacterium]|nr:Crp/Fnr family transcriptional regulator [Saprospiraceae bacterium]
MALLAEKNIESNKRMLVLTQKHLRGRLADALLLLHKQYGCQTDNKTLNVQLKRAELAALANMTTANAIRVLSVFAKEQLIETNKRNISILNIEGLIRVSQLG